MKNQRCLRFSKFGWRIDLLVIFLALLVFYSWSVLSSREVKAAGPNPRPPAINPLDKEKDLLDKQRLEEKITRELQEQRRRISEKSRSDKEESDGASVGSGGSEAKF